MTARNRNSEKGLDNENRTRQNMRKNTHNKKLPDNNPEKLISTWSDTNIGNDDTRGGK